MLQCQLKQLLALVLRRKETQKTACSDGAETVKCWHLIRTKKFSTRVCTCDVCKVFEEDDTKVVVLSELALINPSSRACGKLIVALLVKYFCILWNRKFHKSVN